MKAWLLAHPILTMAVVTAINGIGVAMRIDYDTFSKWNTWREAHDYDWSRATFRWFQGAVMGVVGGGALGALVQYLVS